MHLYYPTVTDIVSQILKNQGFVFLLKFNFSQSLRTEPDVDKFTADLSDENSLSRTKKCSTYFHALHEMIFQTNASGDVSFNYPSEESAPAKLAFSFTVHDNPSVFEILLHLTFRPYNSYCIYIDNKATDEFKSAIQSLVECYQSHFPNTTIFLHPQPAEIFWGDYAILNADLRCLQALYERNRFVLFLTKNFKVCKHYQNFAVNGIIMLI